MSLLSPADLELLKRDNPCDQVAAQWVSLRAGSSKFGPRGFTGPCPLHSPDPAARDSTRFECSSDGWVCVACGGGDVFKLVALRNGLDPERDFRRAIALPQGGLIKPFTGAPAKPLSEDERRALDEARAEAARLREEEHNEFRDRERRAAYDIYYKFGYRLRHPAAEPGRAYLRARLRCDLPPELLLRVNPEARFYVPDRPRAREIHRGPALLAAIRRGGRFVGVHQTFLDLANPPKCKARIVDPKTGQTLDAKKVRGSARGCHIELTPCESPRELVLGEGLEKVLAVYSAYLEGGRDLGCTAFWSAMNLDNLGGKHASAVPHPTLTTELGRARRVPGPEPDLDAPGIEIPDTVERLILLGDSTSDAFTTHCVLARAAKRYAREGRQVVCAWSPAGKDFDDLLREAA